MAEQKNNIRIIITSKADLALDDLEKKFNLEENYEESIKRSSEGKSSKIVTISHLSKDFASGIILEKDLVASLQKDLEIPAQTAGDISKEIITKVVPLLKKFTEEELKDQPFTEDAPKKTLDMQDMENKNKPSDIFPKIKPPIGVAEILEKKVSPTEKESSSKVTSAPKKQERIKKPIVPPEDVKESVPQPRQSRGPNRYREPIE